MSNSEYLLAVESAISGGSLALFQDDRLIVSLSGGGSVSRAEDLLPNIASLLEEAMISRSDLGTVAVSLGPGSYTGLRIGISTVMGLCRALEIEAVGVTLFHSLSFKASLARVVSVVPMGRSDLCFAMSSEPESPRIGSIEDLAYEITKAGASELRCHSDIHAPLSRRFHDQLLVTDLGRKLAESSGRAASILPITRRLDPIYAPSQRFTPAP